MLDIGESHYLQRVFRDDHQDDDKEKVGDTGGDLLGDADDGRRDIIKDLSGDRPCPREKVQRKLHIGVSHQQKDEKSNELLASWPAASALDATIIISSNYSGYEKFMRLP